MKLESGRGMLHEWSLSAPVFGSKGDRRKFLLLLILDEYFDEGRTELDGTLV